MVLADLLMGWALAKLFQKPAATAPLPQAGPSTEVPATAPAPALGPASTPTPAVAPTEAPAPTFPVQQTAAPSSAMPSSGKKKAIEVWQVKPALQSMIVGMLSGASGTTIASLEATFPEGWQACKVVTPQEIATAKAMLKRWRKGAVIFMGPPTLAGRRAYRMTEHSATAVQPAATPVASPATPKPPPAPPRPPAPTPAPMIVPAVYVPPAPTPAPVAPVATPAPTTLPTPAPAPVATPATPTAYVTTVRKGEGLAQIAKRLGQPESRDSVLAIREANVPQGPDAVWKKTDLMKGGLAKSGRPGGIQPGDHLFVPVTWWPIDASKL